MFILIVAGGYPTKKHPLMGIFEYDQAKALHNAGHKVVFISLDLQSIRRKRQLGKSFHHIEGFDIFNISFPLGNVPPSLFITVGKLVLKSIFKDVLIKHGLPDFIHAHFTNIAAIASVLKTKYRIPLIVTEHSSLIHKDVLDKTTRTSGSLAYGNADKVIAVSQSLSKRLLHHFNIDSVVVNNIVDLETFHHKPQEHSHFQFISVGNLLHVKGFDLLIKAFSKLEEANLRLLIVGEGPERSKLQKLIDDLSLGDQVHLPGRKTRSEINELMNKSDAFVLASRAETFGVVYIEAMAAGLPVIATRCGGPDEFVNKSNGILVPVNDIISLSEALSKIKNNIEYYDRKFISEQCRSKFSPGTIANQLIKEYEKIIKKQ